MAARCFGNRQARRDRCVLVEPRPARGGIANVSIVASSTPGRLTRPPTVVRAHLREDAAARKRSTRVPRGGVIAISAAELPHLVSPSWTPIAGPARAPRAEQSRECPARHATRSAEQRRTPSQPRPRARRARAPRQGSPAATTHHRWRHGAPSALPPASCCGSRSAVTCVGRAPMLHHHGAPMDYPAAERLCQHEHFGRHLLVLEANMRPCGRALLQISRIASPPNCGLAAAPDR